MSHLEDDLLQRYSDGDLPDHEADEIATRIEDSEIEQRRLGAIHALGEFVRLRADDTADDLDTGDLFARIEAKLEEAPAVSASPSAVSQRPTSERAPSKGSLRVIEGGAETPSMRPARPEAWKIFVPAAALLAAAAVLIVVLNGDSRQPSPEQANVTTQIEEGTVTVVEAPHGSEVVEVDFGANTGTVFEVEGSTGEPIAVVWISDETLEEAMQ
jgi:hypothetical protein